MIADDHAIVRAGLKQFLSEEIDLQVTVEAVSGDDALKYLRADNWDVLLLDIAMPGKNVLELIHLAKLHNPKKPILVLSMYPEDQYALRVLRAGADGYMGKESAPDQLIAAIRKLAQGGKYISSTMSEHLLKEITLGDAKLKHSVLTDREFQVFIALANCKRLTDIAVEMALSVKTISTYRNRVLKKMDLSGNGEIIHYALEHQLIELKS
jgi:DNA-binding NarL/FixJ family response regulator